MAKEWFSQDELACGCGCGYDDFDQETLFMLNLARTLAGAPFVINSGNRCKAHNTTVGGSAKSSHLKGCAVDIKATDSKTRYNVLHGLISAGFTRIGVAKTFIHADNDKSKSQEVTWLY